MESELRELIKLSLEKLKKLKRNHANFFDWYDKPGKELGITNDFIVQVEKLENITFTNYELGDDPPDIVLERDDGTRVGMEITELVNQEVIEKDIKKDPTYVEGYLSWDREKTIRNISLIIRKKDVLCERAVNKYEEIILLIHTDEPRLDSETLKSYIRDVDWPATKSVKKVYILIAYEPAMKGYTLMRLF